MRAFINSPRISARTQASHPRIPAICSQPTPNLIEVMKSRSIKSMILAGLALAATAFAFAPASANAGPSRCSGHCGSCSAPVYQQQVFTGCYDRCGNPIFRWVTVAHSCRSSHHGHGRGHSHRDYGYRSGHNHGYSRPYVRPSGFSINIQSFSSPSRGYCR
jgi:hypothetical protein